MFVHVLACPAISVTNTAGLQSSNTAGTVQTLACFSGAFPSGVILQLFTCNTLTGQWSPNPATTFCGAQGSG